MACLGDRLRCPDFQRVSGVANLNSCGIDASSVILVGEHGYQRDDAGKQDHAADDRK